MTHADIIARLTAATGPDCEIDTAIADALDPTFRNSLLRHATKYSASLDACLALIERVLPGWTIAWIGQDDHKTWHAELRKGHATSYSTLALAGAPTPALACLLALFYALEAQEPHHG